MTFAARDLLAELLVERLAPHPTLAMLEGRVWHGELATIPDPIYPVLTFHRDGMVQDWNGPMNTADLVVIANSIQGQDEAWSIYAAARTLLDRQYFAKEDLAVRLMLQMGPLPDPLRDPTPMYRVITLYRVQGIGG